MAYGEIGDIIIRKDSTNNKEYEFTCISANPVLYICPTPFYDDWLVDNYGEKDEGGNAYYTINNKQSLLTIANVVSQELGQDVYPTFTHIYMYLEPFEFKLLLSVLNRYAYKKILKDNKLYIQLYNDLISVTFPLLGFKNNDNYFCLNLACIFGVYSSLLYDLDNTWLNGVFLRLLNTVSYNRIIPYDMFELKNIYCPNFKLYSRYLYCSINQYYRDDTTTFNSFLPVRVPIYMYLTEPKHFIYKCIKVTRYAPSVQYDIRTKKVYIRFFFSLNTYLELTFLLETELEEFPDNTEFNYGSDDVSNKNTILFQESNFITDFKRYNITEATAYYNTRGEYPNTCLFIAAITTTHPGTYSNFLMINIMQMPSFGETVSE